MAANQLQFQQETMASIQNLKLQLSQMTSDIRLLELKLQLNQMTSEVFLESEKQFKKPPQRAPKIKNKLDKFCTNVRELKECNVVSVGSSFLEVL